MDKQPDFYKYYSSLYGRFLFRWVDLNKIRIIEKEFCELKNKDAIILDLGCGSGNISKRLFENGIKVVCCDFDKRFLIDINKLSISTVCLDLNNNIPFKEIA